MRTAMHSCSPGRLTAFLLTPLLLLVCSLGSVNAYAARITHFAGEVSIVSSASEDRKIKKVDESVEPGETVVTGSDAETVLEYDSGSVTYLGPDSALEIEGESVWDQLKGSIYYIFGSGGQSDFENERSVKTVVATLGIRGTRFLVDSGEDRAGVSLTEGVVKVAPRGEYPFSIERLPDDMSYEDFSEAQAALFDRFKNNGFEDYQKRQKKAFKTFKDGFFVESGNAVELSQGKASFSRIPESTKDNVERIERLLEELDLF